MSYIFLFSIFIVSVLVSWIVTKMFGEPIEKILSKIINDPISFAWKKYMIFAIYVTGISSGVRIWEIEKYFGLSGLNYEDQIIEKSISLTSERWILEILRTIIDSLQGISITLLIFFIFALIAFVITKAFENKKSENKDI